MYYCFRIAPYGAPKIRAVKKEQKEDYLKNGVRVLPAHTFCREMKLP